MIRCTFRCLLPFSEFRSWLWLVQEGGWTPGGVGGSTISIGGPFHEKRRVPDMLSSIHCPFVYDFYVVEARLYPR